MSEPPPALSARGLERSYADVTALAGVDLDVAAGERFCLLGPSGSGKTTLLRLVAGFEQPDAGTVSLHGARVDALPPERRNLGVVFQDYALFPHRTVAQNVAFGLRMRRVPKAQRRARVAEVLDLVRLGEVADRKPDQLSGGQRQRVALARALAPEPALLLLDEPLANLDRRLREALREELARVHTAVGVTIVLVTHDQEEALSLADRVGVLREGRLEQVGTPVELWQHPVSRFVAEFLGEMNLLPARLVTPGCAELPALGGARVRVVADTGGPDGLACLRPEAVLVTPPSHGVGGVVERVAYAGGSATYRIALPGAPALLARAALPDGRPAFACGDRVGVGVADVTCRLLPC
jgi:putative spermidine/putrescine transport system ATP-binding protein